jgi:hypothetical protein
VIYFKKTAHCIINLVCGDNLLGIQVCFDYFLIHMSHHYWSNPLVDVKL